MMKENNSYGKSVLFVEECEVKSRYVSKIFDLLSTDYKVDNLTDFDEAYGALDKNKYNAVVFDGRISNVKARRFYEEAVENFPETEFINVFEESDDFEDYDLKQIREADNGCKGNIDTATYNEVRSIAFQAIKHLELNGN